jgi:signal transduction histidine kinase
MKVYYEQSLYRREICARTILIATIVVDMLTIVLDYLIIRTVLKVVEAEAEMDLHDYALKSAG